MSYIDTTQYYANVMGGGTIEVRRVGVLSERIYELK